MKKKVTLQDIAQQAGVSVATVSQILNGKYKERWKSMAERAQHIRQIAHQLHYQPNAAARAMRKNRFHAIGLLDDPVKGRSHLPIELLEGIHQALQAKNEYLILAKLPESQLKQPHYYPRILKELTVDGLLVNFNTDRLSEVKDLLDRHQIPSVWINAKLPTHAIYPDDYLAAYELTQAMVKEGIERIGYINSLYQPFYRHYSIDDRERGYQDAMQNLGLTPILFNPNLNGLNRLEIMQVIKRWITDHHLQGIICYGRELLFCYPFLYGEKKFRLQGVGIFCGEYVETFGPIWRAELPNRRIGYESVLMLYRQIEEEEVFSPPSQAIPFQIIPPKN